MNLRELEVKSLPQRPFGLRTSQPIGNSRQGKLSSRSAETMLERGEELEKAIMNLHPVHSPVLLAFPAKVLQQILASNQLLAEKSEFEVLSFVSRWYHCRLVSCQMGLDEPDPSQPHFNQPWLKMSFEKFCAIAKQRVAALANPELQDVSPIEMISNNSMLMQTTSTDRHDCKFGGSVEKCHIVDRGGGNETEGGKEQSNSGLCLAHHNTTLFVSLQKDCESLLEEGVRFRLLPIEMLKCLLTIVNLVQAREKAILNKLTEKDNYRKAEVESEEAKKTKKWDWKSEREEKQASGDRAEQRRLKVIRPRVTSVHQKLSQRPFGSQTSQPICKLRKEGLITGSTETLLQGGEEMEKAIINIHPVVRQMLRPMAIEALIEVLMSGEAKMRRQYGRRVGGT
ncbi:unnamed protein product [Protopolystoma xenopodis]|uniref:Uncharacterized protein n=1 Tax=Protopolystoma xenopodis TaxID=117903 RepID=A0A3S5B0A7_9PLAT|nr:unnamed protein product [Protopolystoma xenopodis]